MLTPLQGIPVELTVAVVRGVPVMPISVVEKLLAVLHDCIVCLVHRLLFIFPVHEFLPLTSGWFLHADCSRASCHGWVLRAPESGQAVS